MIVARSSNFLSSTAVFVHAAGGHRRFELGASAISRLLRGGAARRHRRVTASVGSSWNGGSSPPSSLSVGLFPRVDRRPFNNHGRQLRPQIDIVARSPSISMLSRRPKRQTHLSLSLFLLRLNRGTQKRAERHPMWLKQPPSSPSRPAMERAVPRVVAC